MGVPPPGDSLDDVAPAHVLDGDRVLLKIDVQGYEAAVLRGAHATLERVHVLECEIPMQGMYERQAGCRDLIDSLDDLGFKPFSVEPNYVDPATGHVMDADFAFARRPSD
jgi:hypothetical protein